MSKQVLNRPMFAKMKDGSVKPVQYANLGGIAGVFIQGGKYALPYLNRFGKYIVPKGGLPYKESASKALTTVKNTLPAVLNKIRSGLPAIKGNIFSSGKVGDKVLKSRTGVGGSPPNVAGLTERGISRNLPALYNPRLYPSVPRSIPGTSSIIPGIDRGTLLSSGASLASLAALDNRNLFDEKDEKGTQSPPNYNDGDNPEGVSPGAGDTRRGDLKKPTEKIKITDAITEDIKSGSMDEMIKDKITLFEKYLGKDTDKRRKGAAYEAMVEFGLNFATARGGNTMDKIARSAKDPLKNFAAVGREIVNRAEKIKMAGIESGITAYEKAENRAVDREAIAADFTIEQMKLQAPKTDRLTFVSEKFDSIAANPDLIYSLTDFAYTKDKKGKRVKRPEFKNKSDGQILQGVIDDMWKKGNAVELPSGAAGDELFASLPSGTFYLDVETGSYNTKP